MLFGIGVILGAKYYNDIHLWHMWKSCFSHIGFSRLTLALSQSRIEKVNSELSTRTGCLSLHIMLKSVKRLSYKLYWTGLSNWTVTFSHNVKGLGTLDVPLNQRKDSVGSKIRGRSWFEKCSFVISSNPIWINKVSNSTISFAAVESYYSWEMFFGQHEYVL